MGYIKSIRPPACIFPGLLLLASLRLSTGSIRQGWLPAIATIVIFFAIMAQNDLRDRWHDSKKGKTFVLENARRFKWFTFGLWLAGSGLAWVASCHHLVYLWIFGFFIIGGLVYSELHALPMASNCLVSLIVGSSALFPLLIKHQSVLPSVWLFVAITMGMFAREILKDFDDRNIDPGYKWTFIQRFGETRSMLVVSTCLALSSVVLLLTNLAAIPLVLLFMPYRPSLTEIGFPCEEDNYSSERIDRIKFLMDVGQAIIVALYLVPLGGKIPHIFMVITIGLSCAAAAYLIGSIPFSWLIVWFLGPKDEQGKRKDLRFLRSGNVGATNATLSFKRPTWYPVLILLDAGKAIAAIVILKHFFPGDTAFPLLIGFAATLGHCFPIFLGYRRGRGIACTLGVLALCLPALLPILLGIWLAIVLLSKKMWLKLDQRVWRASVLSAATMPLFAQILLGNDVITNILIAQAALVILCHRDHYMHYLEPLFEKWPDPDMYSIFFWLCDLIWKPEESPSE